MMQFPEYSSFNFPCGEKHVRVTKSNSYHDHNGDVITDIKFEFKNNEDVVELLLLVNALKNMGCGVGRLYIPYLPFSRQDRVCYPGDAFSLEVMIDLINGINAKSVIVIDPHSNAVNKIKNLKIIHQHDIFQPYFFDRPANSYVFVGPDKGSRAKISVIANKNNANWIYFDKVRDPETGKLTGFKVHDWKEEYFGLNLIVVDDIADKGGTFLGIAQELEKLSPGSKMILMVTHGFFTHDKGVHVFDGIYDEVYTRNGRVL